MPKIVAIYERVSSFRQDTKSQRPDLERWAEGETLPVQWFSDQATGRNMDRPAWQKLEAAIRAGKVAKVVVWKLDRLGRCAFDLQKLFGLLRQLKVDLVCVAGGFLGLDTPEGRLVAGIIAQVAEFDNELRSERIVAGQQAVKAGGGRIGGGKAGRLVNVKPEHITEVQRMDAEGRTKVHMAKVTGLSQRTIYRLLKRPVEAA